MYPLQDLMTSQPNLRYVLEVLEQNGYQAHLVGGSVRNALMGLPASDFDVSTNAHPDAVQRLFEAQGLSVHPTGIEHGTLTVSVGEDAFEVTTWRRDVATDGRRATVAFATELADDANRRDFTMNALYADRHGRVLDPTGSGVEDAKARRVRFVGDAQTRVLEDHLRILRYFRFSATLEANCAPEDPALDVLALHAHLTDTLPRERVGAEMVKLLGADNPVSALLAMFDGGHLQSVLAETRGLKRSVLKDRLTRLVAQETMMGLAPCFVRRLAALVEGSPAAEIKLSKAQSRHFDRMTAAFRSPYSAAELGYRHGVDDALDALCLRYAYRTGDARAQEVDEVQRGADKVLPLRGADLTDRFKGQQIREALQRAEASWLASDFSLGREALLAAV
jgi:poly(A) polymerase